ncbi:MAG TPA: hypothetical protein VFV05_06360 [Methylomirabilota bacterium]|nr:hypothetical protein [Methylomirabilota bacterium]
MKGVRVAVAVAVVLLWGLFVPMAMAADHCAAMSGMCEGPCGASSTVTAPTVPASIGLVSHALPAPVPAVPQVERPTLELPPKSLTLSA